MGRETVSKLLQGRRQHPSHQTMVAIAKALDLLPELVEPEHADVPDVARRSSPTPPDQGEIYLEGFREGFRQGIAWATRTRLAGQATGSLDQAVGPDQRGTLGQPDTPPPLRAPPTAQPARRRPRPTRGASAS
jgi:hypothetical protein